MSAREKNIRLTMTTAPISFNVREKKNIQNNTNMTLIANWTSNPIKGPSLLQPQQQLQQSLNADTNIINETIITMGAIIINIKTAVPLSLSVFGS